MRTLPLTIVPETDLLCPSSHAVGNVIETDTYVSGSKLRGAFAAVALQNGVDPAGEDFRTMFWGDDVRFENAYPMERNSSALTMPVPLSAFTCKTDPGRLHPPSGRHGHPIFDALRDGLPCSCPECKSPLERVRGGYRSTGKPPREWVWNVATFASTHTEIGDGGVAQEGVLFTLEQLPRHQKLEGAIVFRGSQAEAAFRRVFGIQDGEVLRLRLGRGHGRAQVACRLFRDGSSPIPLHSSFDDRWQVAVATQQRDGRDDNTVLFSLTLFSEVILLDRCLRPVTNIDHATLAELLRGGEGGEGCIGELVQEWAFATAVQVGGWNNAHVLPKPADLAIRKGSAFLYRYAPSTQGHETEVDGIKSALKAIEIEGIGERRNEGFGRVIVNDPFHWHP